MAMEATTRPEASSTETVSSSSCGDSPDLDKALASVMEKGLKLQLFRSLTRIERHLSRRDPKGLRRISEWYSSRGSEEPSADDEQEAAGRSKNERHHRRKFNFRQRRMEQNEIDNANLKYLKIPKGIATRGLLVPPQPAWLFSDTPPGFNWLVDSNVSNAEDSSRRSTEREAMRQTLGQWVFLFFRVLRRNWECTVVEEKKAAPDVNMYAEEHMHKWTRKLRFKIMRQVPVKVALSAFMSRLGLETNAHIVFCRDGFYGLMDVGNIHGEITKTPCAMIGFNSTPRYLGLKNGDNIFVNACSVSQRQMMEDAPRHDAPKKRKTSQLSIEDGEEGGEYDIDTCEEEKGLLD